MIDTNRLREVARINNPIKGEMVELRSDAIRAANEIDTMRAEIERLKEAAEYAAPPCPDCLKRLFFSQCECGWEE